MLDINLKYEDIEIANIEKENIEDVFIWWSLTKMKQM